MMDSNNSIQLPTVAALIPDILLSQAKDERYISGLRALLSQVASVCILPWCPSGRNNNNSNGYGGGGRSDRSHFSFSEHHRRDGDNHDIEDDEYYDNEAHYFIDRILPELNLLATIIVHSSAIVCFNRATKSNARQSTLGMDSLNLIYSSPVMKKGTQDLSIISSKSQSNRDSRFGRMFLFSFWNIPLCYRIVFLQSIIPYLLQRVSRGGWLDDLRALCPMNEIERIDNNDESEVERNLRNDERLRGSARRRLFDEQRRRMQQSSVSSQSNSNHSLSDVLINNESTIPSNNILNSIDTDADQLTTATSLTRDVHGGNWRSKIRTLCWKTLRKISLASMSMSHGAHSLPSTHNNALAPTNERLDRMTKLILWFLRLHLALFYWNGMYPTVLHRLTGVSIMSSGGGNTSSIVANRPTYKPIAAIILFQAGTALTRAAADASIEVAHFIQIAFFRWHRRRRNTRHHEIEVVVEEEEEEERQRRRRNSGSRYEYYAPNTVRSTERTEYMSLIEECVPGIDSVNNQAKKKYDGPKSKREENQTKRDSKNNHGLPCCGICLNERKHPSIPSICGHVFCWNCILHWVSNVRAECPLCRAETRPQDIIPLYNYS